eukprot:CAMPEP_0196592162 /NCGR_PEP_ID=MMETSP1081-20130531/71894_1 /TAXON_ID=36882 /ORGANISM="Pyramimonas amylifera, Strain CCMP720" /LENGTH=416 /DNA_ID=CAMNT_0041915759 /DNA_START=41 /DNA_END=1291 /DNA_ORIENTATION=+
MPAGRYKKSKPTELQTIKQVGAFLPESALYTKLVSLERQVDASLERKLADVREVLSHPTSHVENTLRLYIFNTHAHQGSAAQSSQGTPSLPSWTLYICGRLLDHPLQTVDPPPPPGVQAQAPQTQTLPPPASTEPLTDFLSSMHIQLDPTKYPGANGSITWESDKGGDVRNDGFELKRVGRTDVNVTITLQLATVPGRFQLASELASLLGITVATKPAVIQALWQYMRIQGVSFDPTEAGMLKLNEPLKELFQKPRLHIRELGSALQPFLTPPGPLTIRHIVRVSGVPEVSCYDISVDVPMEPSFPPQELTSLETNLTRVCAATDTESVTHNRTIAAAVQKIKSHQRRREFFLGFSQSPVDFVRALVASQSRDLKAMKAGDAQDSDYERRSEFYSQSWVEDAVMRYFYRQNISGQN